MSKKKRIVSLCLCLLLLFSITMPLVKMKSASASQVSVQWGHLSPENDVEGEGDREYDVSAAINNTFYSAGSWGSQDAYGYYTQLGYVVQVLQFCEYPYNYVDWATTWWVGDYLQSGDHYGFYGENGQNTYDYTIYAYGNHYWWFQPPYYDYWQYIGSKQYFNFIWTCTNGGLNFSDSSGTTWDEPGFNVQAESTTYPIPESPFDEYGYFIDPYSYPEIAVGMGLAWTGTADMSIHGYSQPDQGSYCYIGFENHSPNIVDSTDYNNKDYGDFAIYFYRYALGLDNGGTHGTIAQSLNYASLNALGCGFSSSDLHCGSWEYIDMLGEEMDGYWIDRMRVFGNSGMSLP